MLEIGTDQVRIKYLRSFHQYYTEHNPQVRDHPIQADGAARYQVMKNLIPEDEVSEHIIDFCHLLESLHYRCDSHRPT